MVSHYILRIKDGKCVTVRRSRGSMKLSAVDQQGGDNEPVVHIQKRTMNQKNQIAFHCHHKGDCYFPKVVENSLKVEKAPCRETSLSDDHWFEKVNLGTGEYYGLRSVTAPLWYLSVSGSWFSVSDDDNKCVLITDEMREASC